MHAPNGDSPYDHQKQVDRVFANCNKEDLIYPLTVKEIAQAQTKFQIAFVTFYGIVSVIE